MSLYFVPALIGLVFKLFVLAYAARGARISIVFLSLIVVFAVHNAIELVGYILYLNAQPVEALFRPYYVATLYLLMYVLLHGLTVSQIVTKAITAGLITVTTVLSILILFTDTLVAGHYPIGYSITAVHGTYYWVVILFALSTLLANIAVLIYGYRTADSELGAIRCIYSLFALAPVMLVFFIAVIFKLTGAGINAAGMAPIATALFLAIMLKCESKHKFSDVRRLLPFSPERKTATGFMQLLDDYTNNQNQPNAYKQLREGIEREIIFYSLEKSDHNITKASKMMGLENRSTLYSMIDRLNINKQELKERVKT